MELRHLRYFARAAELLHFTQAADSLQISQPTLSTHMHQLEEELGLPLFERVGRTVRLTEAGTVYLEHSTKALREIELAKEEIAGLKGELRGTLRISALLGYADPFLPGWVTQFCSMHQHVNVSMRTGTADRIEQQLQDGEVDIGLSYVPPIMPDVGYTKLFSRQIFFVVSPQHPLAQRESITLKEICKVPLAMPLIIKDLGAQKIFEALFTHEDLQPTLIIEIDDLQALLKIAQAGNVATMLGRLSPSSHPQLRFIPIADADHRIDFGVLWNETTRFSPPAKAFLEHIKEECRKTDLNE